MDVVWMAKYRLSFILKNQSGQSAVEYILLLAVLSALTFSVLNNAAFKDFMAGNSGLFLTIRKGMEYSYRYGLPSSPDIDLDEKRDFDLQSNKHDLYFNTKENASRFFTGPVPYGK